MGRQNNKHTGPLHLIAEGNEADIYGEIILNRESGYSLTLTIREYKEESDKISEKIKEANELYERLHARKAVSEWTPDDKKTDAANREVRDRKIREAREEEETLKARFSDVVYVCILVDKGLNLDADNYNRAFGEGNVRVSFTLEEHVRGGGKVYIEAMHKGEMPFQRKPYGIFISSLDPYDIADIVWTDHEDNKIEGKVAPGSYVFLHIYTRNLYGRDLKIQLMDNDSDNYYPGDKDDELSDINDDKDILYDTTAEVNVYKASDLDKQMSNQIGGLLINGESTIQHVQKAVIRVKIDPLYIKKGVIIDSVTSTWKNQAGTNLEIYPIVTVFPEADRIPVKKNYLCVKNVLNSGTSYTVQNYRSPIKIGQVTTDIAQFLPCYYTSIKAKVGKLPEILLYDDSDIEKATAKEFILPLTAGVNQGPAQLSLSLDTDTENCLFETIPGREDHIHTNKVVNLRGLKTIANYGFVTGDFIKWDSDEVFRETGKIDEKNKNKVSGNITIKVPYGAQIKASAEFKLLEEPIPFQLQVSDQLVNLNVVYDYTNRETQHPLLGLAKTLWPNNRGIAQRYPIVLNTCRNKEKTILIDVYPDVIWTLQLGFNYDAAKFQEIQDTYHDRWALVGESYASSSRRNNLSPDEKKEFKQKAEEAFEKSDKNVKPALLNPATALSGDIIKLKIGLICELDDKKIKIEASDVFPEITDFLKKIFKIIEKVDQILDGTDHESASDQLVMHPARERTLRERVESKRKKAKRNIEFKFLPPQVGLSISWQAERPKDVSEPLMGTTFTGKIAANPLFGYKIKYDIFELLSKAIPHPAVKAAIMLLKFLDTIAGDSFDIKFDFIATGKVKLEGEGKISSLSESNLSSDNPFNLKGEIEIKIESEISVQGVKETFFFGKVGAYGKLAGSVTTGVTFAGSIAAQESGLFAIPYIEFHGIILHGEARGGLVMDTRNGKIVDEEEETEKKIGDLESMPGVHGEMKGDIIVMKAYRWDLAEWKIPIIRSNN